MNATAKLKIGIFTDSYLPSHDGVATSVYSSARELRKLGHEIYIIAPDQHHHKDFKNVYRLLSIQLYKEPPIRWGLEIPQPSLFKISNLEFDVIHGHSGGPISLLGWQIAQIRSVPFVETYHTMWRHYGHYFPISSLWKPRILKKICAIFGNDCDALIAPTEKVKKELISYGVKKPVYIVPSGIDLEEYENEEVKKNFLHHKLGIDGDKKILLTVGRFEHEKNDPFLLRAFAKIEKNYPDCVLVMIGEGRDEPSLKKLAESLNIAEKVYFVDKGIEHAEMPKVYKDGYLFLFASQTESQGLAIVEALASGVPVVAVADDAYIGVVEDNQNGYLSSKEESVFCEKVVKLLNDSQLHKQFSVAAKTSAEKFSAEKTVKKLETVYFDVLSTHKMNMENFWQKTIKAII